MPLSLRGESEAISIVGPDDEKSQKTNQAVYFFVNARLV
jgi:hypothetical protein